MIYIQKINDFNNRVLNVSYFIIYLIIKQFFKTWFTRIWRDHISEIFTLFQNVIYTNLTWPYIRNFHSFSKQFVNVMKIWFISWIKKRLNYCLSKIYKKILYINVVFKVFFISNLKMFCKVYLKTVFKNVTYTNFTWPYIRKFHSFLKQFKNIMKTCFKSQIKKHLKYW